MLVLIRTNGGQLAAVDAARVVQVYRHTPHAYIGEPGAGELTRIELSSEGCGPGLLNAMYTAEPIESLVRRINAARQGIWPALPPEPEGA